MNVFKTESTENWPNLDCGWVDCMGKRGNHWYHPDSQAGPLSTNGGLFGAFHLQRRDEGAVACCTHGGQEEDAGVHVHGGHRADNLTHHPAEGPAEVQSRVHRPEGQGEDELKVSERQAHHIAINGWVVLPVAGMQKEQRQQVTHKTECTDHQVDQRNDYTHLWISETEGQVLCKKVINKNTVKTLRVQSYTILSMFGPFTFEPPLFEVPKIKWPVWWLKNYAAIMNW